MTHWPMGVPPVAEDYKLPLPQVPVNQIPAMVNIMRKEVARLTEGEQLSLSSPTVETKEVKQYAAESYAMNATFATNNATKGWHACH